MAETDIKTLWQRDGIYYFRRAVPDRLREAVGKTMLQISLRTGDLTLAKRKHAVVAAEVAAAWSALEGRRPAASADASATTAITRADAMALAGEIYADLVEQHQYDAGEPEHWEAALTRLRPALSRQERGPGAVAGAFGGHWGRGLMAERIVGVAVDRLLRAKGVSVSLVDRRRICLRTASAMAQAYEVLARRAAGDFTPDPRASRFPPPVEFKGWRAWYSEFCDERRPQPSSKKRQVGVLEAFFAFLGHDSPARVREADARRWMVKRLNEAAVSTVRNADLAHPRAFFGWCKTAKKMPTNPFRDVHVHEGLANSIPGSDGETEVVPKMRGYNRVEAFKVLEATLVPPSGKLSAHSAAARRWVPWLCAYSGARVGEMAQLRRQDVFEEPAENGSGSVWVIHITPEAGRVKDHERRKVAVHPHLIEQGFLEFVSSSRTETLFYDPRRARGGSRANPQSAKVGERLAAWVRDLGIKDETIAPNHAWRHRFRTLLKGLVTTEVLDAIDGHAPKTEGHAYGEVPPEVSLAAVSLIPAYRFEGAETARS